MSVRKTMKVLGGVIAGIVLLLGCSVFLLNTSTVQNRLLKLATDMLTEKLKTQVTIDSVSINLFTQAMNLYGISVDDLQQQPLLKVQELSVDIELTRLLRNEIVVEKASITGLDARLLKPSDGSPSNYQFFLDAFSKKTQSEKEDTVKKEKKEIDFDIHRLQLKNLHVKYNETEVFVGNLTSHRSSLITHNSPHTVTIDQFRFLTDNHKPRKNAQRPHKGFFDPGHLDITVNMKWTIQQIEKDTLVATLTQGNAKDSVSGIDLRDLRMSMKADKEKAHIRNIVIQQGNTTLNISKVFFQWPDKKQGRHLSYTADSISGTTVLTDISRPFAPVLKDFKIPLNLSLNMSGTDSTLDFRNVRVNTQDQKLTIAAAGGITHLKDKRQLAVRFHVSQMQAKKGIKEKIISQFPVKKFMMKQLHRLGNISYTGDFAILWRKEQFQGRLQTAAGPINFHFALNEETKYVSGKVSSNRFQLGHVMELNYLGDIACQADFSFDISKPRTAKMRREKGGKLPIGQVNAHVDDCSYRKVHVRNLFVNIKSDGAEASGDIMQQGRIRDLYCSFSFTNTDDMHKIRIRKPGIKFHKAKKDSKKDRKKKDR